MGVGKIRGWLLRWTALAIVAHAFSGAFGQTMTASDPNPPVDDAGSSKAGDGAGVGEAPARPATGNFFQRLAKAYADDWKSAPSNDAGPKFRGTPSPVDGPPFPFSDWPYGGSVVITKPWTQSSPLMQTLWSGSHGEGWKNSGLQIYGWANFGFNVSTSDKPGYANLPAAYAEKPNTIQPDQEVLYIERQPDTVQTDHFDWGFRVASLYGLDYRFTTAKGVFSEQLLKHNRDELDRMSSVLRPILFP